MPRPLKTRWVKAALVVWFISPCVGYAAQPPLVLTRAEYEDKAHAVWLAQIIGVLTTLPHEHKVASVLPIRGYPKPYKAAIVDDDWYYEMCAVRGFEKFGPGMTVDQLGEMWKAHNCGSWGSSQAARLAMARGVRPADAGLPKNNPQWFTIGPMFSCELYGLLAPGNPNLAGQLARDLGRINGYAEGLDGGVFAAGLVSIAFRETDPREVVRQAAKLIPPDSPFRQSVDLVIRLAEAGKTAREVCDAVEDRWHVEYPATNNAVANGGLLAACVWFGNADYQTTVDLAASAGDFTDCDNFAATALAVAAAMRGTKALPETLIRQLNDRIAGGEMGGLKLTPPVDERISQLAHRTADVGAKVLAGNGATVSDDTITVPYEPVRTQPSQLFRLADLTRDWNPDWTLERAGFGGGNMITKFVRGNTHLNGDTLATYPRDEVRELVLRRTVTPQAGSALTGQVGVDPGRAWVLNVYVDNKQVHTEKVESPAGATDRHWRDLKIDLSGYAGRPVHLRLFQRVQFEGGSPGNAYWRDLRVK